jgi:hypothetical protein
MGAFEGECLSMDHARARVWREGNRWAIEVEIDGVPYTERAYADLASATHAIAQILRQQAGRDPDLDEQECSQCDKPLDLVACSQCGADAFMRTCGHGLDMRPIRIVDEALYCRTCRP